MKQVCCSRVIHLFKSSYRTAQGASVVIAVLLLMLMLLTSTAPSASAASISSLGRMTMTTRFASAAVASPTFTFVADASNFSCPADDVCVFSGTGFTGSVQFGSFPGVNHYIDLHILGGSNWRTRSYKNNGDFRAWLNQFTTNPHGTSFCMSPNSRNQNITGPWDTDRWLLLSANSSGC